MMVAVPFKVCWSSLSTTSWRQLEDVISSKTIMLGLERYLKREVMYICMRAKHPTIAPMKQLTSCSSTPSRAIIPSYKYLISFLLTNWIVFLRQKHPFSRLNDITSKCLQEAVDELFQYTLKFKITHYFFFQLTF